MFLISGLALGLGNAGAGLSNAVQQYRENEFRYRQQKAQEELTAQQLRRAEIENARLEEERKVGNILSAYPVAGGLQIYRQMPDGTVSSQFVAGDHQSLARQTTAMKGILDTISDPKKRSFAQALGDSVYAATGDYGKSLSAVDSFAAAQMKPSASGAKTFQKGISGADAIKDGASLIGGGQIDPKGKYDLFQYEGEILAAPSSESTPSYTQQVMYRKDGKMSLGFRDSKTGNIQDAKTRKLVSNPDAVKPISSVPTTSISSGFRMVPQPDGSVKAVPVTTVTTRQKGGSIAPPSAGGSRKNPSRTVGGKNPYSPQAKQALETVQTGEGMIDRIEEALRAAGLKSQDSVESKARLYYEWRKYQLGFTPDGPYSTIIPTVALLRVMLTTPYLRGLRNFDYVKQIQQHLPGPTDTPKLMSEKMEQLRKNLPLLVRAIEDVETGNVPSPGGSTAPPPGARIIQMDDFLKGGR